MEPSKPKPGKTGVPASSFSEIDDRRAGLALKAIEFALSKPEFLTLDVAGIVLGSLWLEAAHRSGIPGVTIRREVPPLEPTYDEYGVFHDGSQDDVTDPGVLRALSGRDLVKLLTEAHELGTAGQWRRVWTVCRDAFGINGIGR